jgi:hypothetical protein
MAIKIYRIPFAPNEKPRIESLIDNAICELKCHTGRLPNLLISKSLSHSFGSEKMANLFIMSDLGFDGEVWHKVLSAGGPVVAIFSPHQKSNQMESLIAFCEHNLGPMQDFDAENKIIWMDQHGRFVDQVVGGESLLLCLIDDSGMMPKYSDEVISGVPYSIREVIMQVEGRLRESQSFILAYPGEIESQLLETDLQMTELTARNYDKKFGWHPFHAILEAMYLGIETIIDYSAFPSVRVLRRYI